MTQSKTLLITQEISLVPYTIERLFVLCGQANANIKLIATYCETTITQRGNHFHVTGKSEDVEGACTVLEYLYEQAERVNHFSEDDIHVALKKMHRSQVSVAEVADNMADNTAGNTANNHMSAQANRRNTEWKRTKGVASAAYQPNSAVPVQLTIKTRRGAVQARNDNQALYLSHILHHDINFGVGPAGTGKTWLAVACAVEALQREDVDKIMLVRPAVEAGEKLGFLPGDMEEKINPYLQPLFDALHDMMSPEKVTKLMEKNIIEIAPIAFMRGRTLNNAFIILDESQNTTIAQMKMFLTRIGFGSKAVITGDPSQVDLPSHMKSGLANALEVLKDIDGISMTTFKSGDVVRHSLVQKVIEAYEKNNL